MSMKRLWLREGEMLEIPGAPGYYIENKGFTLENYTEEDDEVFEAQHLNVWA